MHLRNTLLIVILFTTFQSIQAQEPPHPTTNLEGTLIEDNNNDNQLGPGEVLEYKVTIRNDSPFTIKNIEYVDTLDPNTTLVSADNAAQDDRYLLTGGGTISVDTTHGVIGNNDLGEELTVVSPPTRTDQGNSLTLSGDGSFTLAANNFRGKDSFDYTVTDPLGNRSTATATIFIAGQLHFVDNTQNGDGSFNSPYGELKMAEDNSAEGDAIFVFRGDESATGQSAGIFVQNNQTLIGQSNPLPHIDAQSGFVRTLPGLEDGQKRPLIIKTFQDAQNGTAIVAGDNTAIVGFRVGDLSATRIFIKGLFARDFGSIYLREISFAHSNSNLLELDTGDVDAIVDGFQNRDPGVPGSLAVNLTQCSGTFEVTGTTQSEEQGIAISGSIDATFGQLNLTKLERRAISYFGGEDQSGSLTIRSPGGQIIFDTPNDSDGISIDTASNFLLEGADGNKFKIVGAGGGRDINDPSNNFGIAISESSNITFNEVSLNTGSASSDTGISIRDSTDITIQNSIIKVNRGTRALQILSLNKNTDQKITIENNSFEGGDNDYATNVDDGIVAVFDSDNGSALDLSILNNRFNAFRDSGITIAPRGNSGTDSKRNNIDIKGNEIFDFGQFGISLQFSGSAVSKLRLEQNTIDGQVNIPFGTRANTPSMLNGLNALALGDTVSDITFLNNDIFDVKRELLAVSTSGSDATIRTLIQNNTFTNDPSLNFEDPAIEVVSGRTGQNANENVSAIIRNNTISVPDSFFGISGFAAGSGLLCMDIANNTLTTNRAFPVIGLTERDSATFQAVNRDNVSALNGNAEIRPRDFQTSVDNVASCPQVQ